MQARQKQNEEFAQCFALLIVAVPLWLLAMPAYVSGYISKNELLITAIIFALLGAMMVIIKPEPKQNRFNRA